MEALLFALSHAVAQSALLRGARMETPAYWRAYRQRANRSLDGGADGNHQDETRPHVHVHRSLDGGADGNYLILGCR